MKRFVFALGLLATVAISESDAGYIVIRIVLEGGSSGGAEGPSGPGMGPGAGPVGMPGIGQPPRPGAGGPGPMAGSGGGPPKPGGGGAPPAPPALGGMPPAPPPLGGMPPNPGGSAGQPGTGGIQDPTRSIYVVVPYTNDLTKKAQFYKKAPMGSFNPYWQPAVKHQFGYANLIDDNTQIQLYMDLGPLAPKGIKTRSTEVTDKYNKWLKSPTDTQLLLDAVTDALEQGFVKESFEYSEKLVAAVKEDKAKVSNQVERFLKAYAQIKDPISRPAPMASEGAQWKERIGFAYSGVKDSLSPHYHMLYWEGMDVEMTRRKDQLEENFQAFYLVNALHGVVLPVPERPQVVILAKSTADVRKLAASLDGSSQVSDAFFSPDHGIVVLSPERLDGVGQTFKRQVQDMYRQGVNRSMLLAGDGPKINENEGVKDAKKAEEVARMQTWTVAERFAENESEWASVSREAIRQLLHATGVLPQHVSLPNWLAEGSANFYQRPKGPVFSKKEDEKDYITVALTTGYGGPNFVRQKQFSEIVRLNQFNPSPKQKADPGQVLRNVVSDVYFTAQHSGLDADDQNLPLPFAKKVNPSGVGTAPAPVSTEDPVVVRRKRAEFVASKAQATSWALYYYLSKTNSAGLDRYLSELSKQPRDLPLDESTRLATFAKAFNLTLDAKRTDDRATFAEFGAAWLQFMGTVPVVGIDVPLVDLAAPPSTGTGTGPGVGPGAPPSLPKPKIDNNK